MTSSLDRTPHELEQENLAAEIADAALCARCLGLEAGAVTAAFGLEAADLADVALRMVEAPIAPPEPDRRFVAALESRIRTEHDRRPRPAGIGIVPPLFATGWRSLMAVTAALLVASTIFLASPGAGGRTDRSPTAWAATSTATVSSPLASPTAAAGSPAWLSSSSAGGRVTGPEFGWPAPMATADG